MEWASDLIFSYEETPESPELQVGQEFMRIAIHELTYEQGLLSFGVYLSAMLPTATTMRYERLEDAFVFIVADMDRGQSLATNTQNEFMYMPPGSESPTNLIHNLPFPMQPPGKLEGGAYRGAWVSVTLALQAPFPKHTPNLFIHAAFENYFSNVVGIDLLRREPVVY